MCFKCKVESAKWKVSYKVLDAVADDAYLLTYFLLFSFYFLLAAEYYVQLLPLFCPRTQEASICHSGSFRFCHRLTPLWA